MKYTFVNHGATFTFRPDQITMDENTRSVDMLYIHSRMCLDANSPAVVLLDSRGNEVSTQTMTQIVQGVEKEWNAAKKETMERKKFLDKRKKKK